MVPGMNEPRITPDPAEPTSLRPAFADDPEEGRTRPVTALVIVDAQNDFSEGGALAVSGAVAAYQAMGVHVVGRAGKYSLLVTTRDEHVDPGEHFAEDPDFVDSWPAHCVAGTRGAALHPLALRVTDLFAEVNPHAEWIEVTKGAYCAAYSGFEGATAAGVGLAEALRAAGVERIDVCGVATDHCVRATVLDGLREGFEVHVPTGLVAAVDPDRGAAALAEMADAGAIVE